MRIYSSHVDDEVRDLLDGLIREPRPTPEDYQQLMQDLGERLGALVAGRVSGSVLLVCTNEDADFLARGVLQGLRSNGVSTVHLACFWNDRVKIDIDQDLAPIRRTYIEPTSSVDAFVVVKSIISSSCVVRTNIAELVHRYEPSAIEIVAPVLLQGAQQKLGSEFDTAVSSRFTYTWFAEDDESKPNGEVVPGIGGSVYELLGLPKDKNEYTPRIVRERRKEFATF